MLGLLGRYFTSLEESNLTIARKTAELSDFFRTILGSKNDKLSKKCITVCGSILGKLGDKSTLLFDKTMTGVIGG